MRFSHFTPTLTFLTIPACSKTKPFSSRRRTISQCFTHSKKLSTIEFCQCTPIARGLPTNGCLYKYAQNSALILHPHPFQQISVTSSNLDILYKYAHTLRNFTKHCNYTSGLQRFTSPSRLEFESRHSLLPNMVKTSSKQKDHTTPDPKTVYTRHKFKGVRMRKWGKWVSEVRMPNSKGRIWLGSYDIPQQAARAYDCAVYCLRGIKAKFNFPDSLPQISSASSLSPAQIQAVAAEFALQELQHPPEDNAAICGFETRSCLDCHQISEEQYWMLLDSVLQDVESSESLNLEEFPPLDLEDIDFLLSPENGGFFPNSH